MSLQKLPVKCESYTFGSTHCGIEISTVLPILGDIIVLPRRDTQRALFVRLSVSSSAARMPSDAKKRAAQKKKELATNRQKKNVVRVVNDENGTTNGSEERELTAEGNKSTAIVSSFLTKL